MAKYMVSIPLAVACSVVLAFSVGCENSAQNDALIGSGIGAGAGAIIGHQSGKTGQGALIGGGAGAVGGYLVGNEQDKQQQAGSYRHPSPPQEPPQESQQPQQGTNSVTVNITNSNGSITPVKLTRSGYNYVGPRGEVYDHFPTEAELKPIYGF
ncbi:MAG: glycine zipper domain-containing protein [Sedimentisphaerales bacterium]